MVFATAHEETFKVREMFRIVWPSCLNDGLSFLFAYLCCSCHNMDLVFFQLGLSSVYLPYVVTTQLIGSNAFRRKRKSTNELLSTNQLLIEMHSRWLSHEAGWENAKSVQSCLYGKGCLLWRISNIKYVLICLTLSWLLHDSICVIS